MSEESCVSPTGIITNYDVSEYIKLLNYKLREITWYSHERRNKATVKMNILFSPDEKAALIVKYVAADWYNIVFWDGDGETKLDFFSKETAE